MLIVILIVNSLLGNLVGNHMSFESVVRIIIFFIVDKGFPVGQIESEDNSTSTYVIFDVWFNRLVANQERCHSTAPAA